MKFSPGQHVVVRGHGVGVVASSGEGKLSVQLDEESSVDINADAFGTLVRPIVSAREATRLVSELCTKPELSDVSGPRSLHHFHRAEREEQLRQLQMFFRNRRGFASEREAELLAVVSEHWVQELAAALGASQKSVRSALRRGKPALLKAVSDGERRALPKPPDVRKAQYARTTGCGGELLIGEYPETEGVYGLDEIADGSTTLGSRVRVRSRPGWWHAFIVEDGAADREGYLLVHESIVEPQWDELRDSASLMVEGGTVSVIDASALSDPELGPREIERLRRVDPYGELGSQVGTYGDGVHQVLCAGPTSARHTIFVQF